MAKTPKCNFCGHPYSSHDFTASASRGKVWCTDCGGECKSK